MTVLQVLKSLVARKGKLAVVALLLFTVGMAGLGVTTGLEWLFVPPTILIDVVLMRKLVSSGERARPPQ